MIPPCLFPPESGSGEHAAARLGFDAVHLKRLQEPPQRLQALMLALLWLAAGAYSAAVVWWLVKEAAR